MESQPLITRSKATVLALVTAIISGISGFLNKFAVAASENPVAFTAAKNAVVAVFLLGAMTLAGKWREVSRLRRRHWILLGLVGLVGGALPFALFFTGLAQTSAVNAALIHKTLFIWVALIAMPLLGERLTKGQWIGVGAIFASNLVVGGFTGFAYSRAELFILLATLLWAAENIIAKKVLADVSSVTVAAARMTIGSALLVAWLVTVGGGFAFPAAGTAAWEWTAITVFFLFGYVTTWYAALKHAPASYVAALLVPAALVTNVCSAIFVTHAFTLPEFAQGALVVLGAGLVIVFARKTPAVEPAVAASLE
jgi:drug/metabolite transporter (DMT)-like permease